ncbi:hypothetical protein LEBR102806_09765 [Levilactobacillus brevis]|nr:Uncharacterised protein [Levilactobacillus brevis]
MSNRMLKKKIEHQRIYLSIAVTVGVLFVVANILVQ